MRIAIGADHRGFALKQELVAWLTAAGHTVEDVGTNVLDPGDDYPEFGAAVGRAVAEGHAERGIVLCGSGIGITIAAGKIPGVRAGAVATPEQARASRSDEDLNVLGLSADALDLPAAQRIVAAFLETLFSGEERHVRRLTQIDALERP